MKFSILVASLESRETLLERLLSCLEPQLTDDVEILVNIDQKEKTVGQKRNELLNMAKGDYIAFVDDDDLVSNDYVSKVLNAIVNNPDCCGIEGRFTVNGSNPKKLVHSIRCDKWYEKDGVCYRTPNHLNPMKRKIALRIGFSQINAGEDRDYSLKIREHIKTESYIDGIIYIYDYLPEGTETNIRPSGYAYRNTFGGNFSLIADIKYRNSLRESAIVFDNDLSFIMEGSNRLPAIMGSWEQSHNLVINGEGRRVIRARTPVAKGKSILVKIERKEEKITVHINNVLFATFNYAKPQISVGFKKGLSDINMSEPKIIINNKEIL